MPLEVDTSKWSGEGEFTQVLLDHLKEMEHIATLRVEDAPSTRAEAGYNFISNELYVAFDTRLRAEWRRRFGVWPAVRHVPEKTMTIRDLEAALDRVASIGPPDYADEGMLQYLRTERIIPPYQTRGYKLVELVRIYEVVPDRGVDGG